MPLSLQLADVSLSHPCPFCGRATRKKGSWFHAVYQYKCTACRRLVRLDTAEKLRLIHSHSDIMSEPCSISPASETIPPTKVRTLRRAQVNKSGRKLSRTGPTT
jgi:hypothetical protein